MVGQSSFISSAVVSRFVFTIFGWIESVKNFFLGLAGFIKEKVLGVFTSLKGKIDDAIEGIKKFFGIKSKEEKATGKAGTSSIVNNNLTNNKGTKNVSVKSNINVTVPATVNPEDRAKIEQGVKSVVKDEMGKWASQIYSGTPLIDYQGG